MRFLLFWFWTVGRKNSVAALSAKTIMHPGSYAFCLMVFLVCVAVGFALACDGTLKMAE